LCCNWRALQTVVFKVDYVVEQIGSKEFGSVFLGQENIALTVVAAGYAKVTGGRPYRSGVAMLAAAATTCNQQLARVDDGKLQVRATGTQQSPYIEDLKKAEEQAQSAGLGLWTKVCLQESQHRDAALTGASYSSAFSLVCLQEPGASTNAVRAASDSAGRSAYPFVAVRL
jgi:endonuclease YncB( thermonuclease family)